MRELALELMLALAPGAILSGFIIIYLYGRSISKSFAAGDYALLAICIYVLGNTVDEMYWINFWLLSYLNIYPEFRNNLLHYGPFFNLIFRELISFVGLILLFIAIIKSSIQNNNLSDARRMTTILYVTLITFAAIAIGLKIAIGAHT